MTKKTLLALSMVLTLLTILAVLTIRHYTLEANHNPELMKDGPRASAPRGWTEYCSREPEDPSC